MQMRSNDGAQSPGNKFHVDVLDPDLLESLGVIVQSDLHQKLLLVLPKERSRPPLVLSMPNLHAATRL